MALRARKVSRALAQLWERSPSTNVSRVRFPDPASYVDWVYWFSTLLREVFLRVVRFSPLLKNQHLIWFDLIYLFDLQSPQLVEHSCSARMIWDLNKVNVNVIIIIIIIIIIRQCVIKQTSNLLCAILYFFIYSQLIISNIIIHYQYLTVSETGRNHINSSLFGLYPCDGWFMVQKPRHKAYFLDFSKRL